MGESRGVELLHLNGRDDLVASPWIDIFSVGLLIEVLSREHCHSTSTALPDDHDEVVQLLKDQELLILKNGKFEEASVPIRDCSTNVDIDSS